MTVIYEPERGHKCSPGWTRDYMGQAGWPNYDVGTIERCDDCGRYWRCVRNNIPYRVSRRPTEWRPVRWWHLADRRAIRAHLAAQESSS